MTVVATRDMGPLETTDAIKARDGGYSMRFRDHSVWAYGDTILAFAGEDDSSWRNSTVSWTADEDAADGITGFTETTDGLGAPVQFLPMRDDELAFNEAHAGEDCEEPCGAHLVLWPGAMVPDPARDRALVFYYEIYVEPGEWNFDSVGTGIAVWDQLDEPPQRPESSPGAEYPTLLFHVPEPGFGVAALADDGWLYAFACELEGGWGKPCRLGRVPLADALDRGAWEFAAGSGQWTTELEDAATLFEGESQMSVHYSEHLGRYLAVYAVAFGERVVLRTAPALDGPWSDEINVFSTLVPLVDDAFNYCGMAHPEFAVDGGRLEYVSYYRTTGDWIGEIRVVEVELEAS